MKLLRQQTGISLITAIFLLVIVALLAVYITNIRAVQQCTSLYGTQGARAIQAARSGIEWGIYESLVATPGCPATTTINIDRFSVQIQCSETSHREGVTDVVTYQLTSTATTGTFGTLDYMQRRIQAKVSNSPP